MSSGREAETRWNREVQAALRLLNDALALPESAAAAWPTVRALTRTGVGTVVAIRRVINDALADLVQSAPDAATLLRQHFVQGQSIHNLTADYARDVSNLHRRRNRAVAELAVILAERNRRQERGLLAASFAAHRPIFGFEALTAQIVADLDDPQAPRVYVLQGIGGIGKTTLAGQVAAHYARDDAVAGVVWTSARQVGFDVWAGRRRTVRATAVDVDTIVAELAQRLGLDPAASPAERWQQVVEHCRQRPYLVVFDNLEIAADLAALAPLIAELATASRILITAREQLLDALPPTLPRHYLTLHELDAPPSFQLLRSAATLAGAEALAAADDAELAQIYAVVGGNPLALWLVAGQAAGVPWRMFLDAIDQAPRGSSGYELYDYLYRRAWEQLDADAQTVLFAMHRFSDGAEPELLRVLSGLSRPAFERAVRNLTRRMLLRYDGRFTIHRLTYTFLRAVIAGWE